MQDSNAGIRSPSAASKLRIVVLGYIVRGPLGGLAWHHLQYVMGLKRLGHDVYFLEDSEDYPACYDPEKAVFDVNPTYGLRFATDAFERTGLSRRWAYYDAHSGQFMGPAAEQITEFCKSADLLLNLSGANPLRSWTGEIPARAFIDTDPVFTQVHHLSDAEARTRAQQHTSYFTFAENISRHDCLVPADGFAWRPTRQPVVVEAWPFTPGKRQGLWTTVMQWDSYHEQNYGGRVFGMKSRSFTDYIDLPEKAGRIFELALGGETAPRATLEEKGWRVVDPRVPTRDPWTYQRYIEYSKGEWSVAKHGYIESRSGWFSERSAAYLASGRPVVTQDTGFSRWINADAGLVPFRTPDEAQAGLEEVNRRYAYHCRRAREVAEEFFDYRRILPALLEQAFG